MANIFGLHKQPCKTIRYSIKIDARARWGEGKRAIFQTKLTFIHNLFYRKNQMEEAMTMIKAC